MGEISKLERNSIIFAQGGSIGFRWVPRVPPFRSDDLSKATAGCRKSNQNCAVFDLL